MGWGDKVGMSVKMVGVKVCALQDFSLQKLHKLYLEPCLHQAKDLSILTSPVEETELTC